MPEQHAVDAKKCPSRPLRSYVKRQGRMTLHQKKALADYAHLLLPTQRIAAWEAIFSRQAPCICEIGFGMGASLLEMAQQSPEQNFIGIEVYDPGIGSLLANCMRVNVTNIRVFQHDAYEVCAAFIPSHSLDRVQVFFPDPWPKKRHHKRRLIQPTFVHLIQGVLKPGGVLHIATDWQPYAEDMLALLDQCDGLANQAGSGRYSERPAYRPLTKYEQRGQRLGNAVFDLIYQTV